MSNVGSAAIGKTLIGAGNGASPTYASIGTNSGLTAHGVLIAEGNSAFAAISPGTTGQVLISNGLSADPSFQTIIVTGAITTITGNTGGSEVPSAGNFNILGTGSITIAGSANTETVQLTGLTNHAVLVGAGTTTITKVGPTATAGQVLQSAGSSADPIFSTATYPSTTTVSQILYSSSTNVVTGLATANRGVLTTDATGIPVITALATDGQLIIGSTAGVPAAASITSSDSSVTITPGSNSISLTVSGGATVGKTITGNTGGALSPTAGNWNIVGTGSTTAAGSGSTLTVQLTGLTNHALQVGAGTATLTQLGAGTTGQVLQTNTTADPTWSTATYPATTTINQILYSSSANTVAGLSTANNGVLTTGTTGIPVITALASNGQLIIGSGSGAPAAATLTAGTGITITNASNSITISASTSGFTWTDVTGGTQTIAVENGYITDNAGGVIYTLPATASLGDTFIIVGKLGLATITPLALQQLLIGSASGAVGVTGTAVSTNVGDSITFVCTTSGSSTKWRAQSFVGNWTLN